MICQAGSWCGSMKMAGRAISPKTWLAVSNDAAATVSGGYGYHRQRQMLHQRLATLHSRIS